MIKKILFTILVAAVVLLFYKIKNSTPQTQKPKHSVPEGKLSTQLMGYIIVGFMLLFSGVYFGLNWLDDRSLITVKVINSSNNISEYQIRKDAIKGRKFTTSDGRVIELGENERLEILPSD